MDQYLLYPVGSTAGCRYAASFLEQAGFLLTDHPAPEITHLLLDVPTFDERGMLRDGTDLKEILRMLPLSITVIGGNLHPEYLSHYRKIDLLKDPGYLAKMPPSPPNAPCRLPRPFSIPHSGIALL